MDHVEGVQEAAPFSGGPADGRASVSRPGRAPIGARTSLNFPAATKDALQSFASRFGQRRGGAVVRIAVRRLVDRPGPLAKEVSAQKGLPVGVQMPVYLGEDLDLELDRLATKYKTSRVAIVRIASERFLAWIAEQGLHSATVGLAAEVYRGAANRDLLIRRRERAEARKGPVPWPNARENRHSKRWDSR